MSARPVRKKLTRPQRACAAHYSGGAWRAVVVTVNGGPSLVAHGTFREISDVGSFAREHRADLLVGVVPSSCVVCRVAPLPSDATADTIGLLTETQFEESIPLHRRGGGLLPGLSTDEPGGALLTAWVSSEERELERLDADCWVCEVAAIAMFGPGVSVSTDRGRESIAVAATGGHKAVARVLRCDGSSDQAWRASVDAAVEETAQVAGLRAPSLGGGRDSSVTTGSPVSDHVAGARAEAGWANQYGVVLGAALVVLSSDERIRSLASVHRDAPDGAASPLDVAAGWLSRPRHAAAVVVICIALMLLIPLGAAWARTLVLESRSQSLRAQEARWREMSDRAEVYRILTEQRWPMTKLLADISRLTPLGVEIEQVTISPEQGVVLRGNSESAEKTNEFSRNLNGSGVFGLAIPGRQDETQGARVQFDISASVINPHAELNDAEDFAGRTLAARLYGERGDNLLYRGGGTPSRPGYERPLARPERTERGERGGAERPAGGEAADAEIPPPLTQEALDGMSRIEVMRSLPRWRQAIRSAPDDSTKARLEEELRMIQAKLAELQGGGA